MDAKVIILSKQFFHLRRYKLNSNKLNSQRIYKVLFFFCISHIMQVQKPIKTKEISSKDMFPI